MNLTNGRGSSGRGSYKMAFSKDYGIAAFQWTDSKVVNCISSYLDFRTAEVHRQIGPERLPFPCPASLVHYQQHMGGVDKADQMRSHFGGFASVSHFKKWYKKTLMTVLDCMLLNGFQLWNMSCEKVPGRRKLKRHEYIQYVADSLLRYKTAALTSPMRTTQRSQARFPNSPTAPSLTTADTADDGKVMVLSRAGVDGIHRRRCLVCSLQSAYFEKLLKKQQTLDTQAQKPADKEMKARAKAGMSGTRRLTSCCVKCEVNAHGTPFDESRRKLIHGFFAEGMSCMDILHSPLGKEVWNIKRDAANKCKVSVRHAHPMVKALATQVADDLGVSDLARKTIRFQQGRRNTGPNNQNEVAI